MTRPAAPAGPAPGTRWALSRHAIATRVGVVATALAALAGAPATLAQTATPASKPPYDANLARDLGANENGMRSHVLVVLKTGPSRVPDGPERDAMFKGHFANMSRLSAEGKLALAGPFDGVDGWRGLYIFAVTDIEEARKLVATDPVVAKGEMVAEYHAYFGSAALMQVPATHQRITRPRD